MRLRRANQNRRRHLRRKAQEHSYATWQRMVQRACESDNFMKLRNSGFIRRMRRDLARLRRIDPEGLRFMVQREFERRRLDVEGSET
jgi:hypothetical protein